jgi:hypothetical protein
MRAWRRFAAPADLAALLYSLWFIECNHVLVIACSRQMVMAHLPSATLLHPA